MKIFSKDQQVISFVLGLIIFTIALFKQFHPFQLNLRTSNTIQPLQQSIIEVSGSVKKPGIYIFDEFPTASHVIQNIYEDSINENCFPFDSYGNTLNTGMHIEFYGSDAKCPKFIITPMNYRKRLVLGIPIKLNRASIDELDIIPGISLGLAKRIVEFRESHGPFKKWKDLKQVNGIGPKKIETFKFYLSLK